MPAISFEKIVVPQDQLMTRSLNQQTGLAGQPIKSGTAMNRGRGIVINWLDRLVERRMEKVERDIARIRKKKAASGAL